MSREGKLVKNTIIITVGKICTQLITFFLLPLYTSILSTEEYGTVDLLNTLVSLLLPIITFQVEQALFRELIEARKDEKKKKKLISTGMVTVSFQCILYLVIFAVLSPFINNHYKIFLATNVVAFIFSSLFLQISRGLGDNKKYAFGSFISAATTIVFNILFLVVVKLGANGMLLGTMLGQIACILYLFFSLKIYRYFDAKEYSKALIKKLWKYSIPLIPNAISWWVFNASDRVLVSGLLGVSQNGILAAATKFSTVYITFYNIFNMSWTESFSLHIKDDDVDQYFNKMFNLILRLFTALAVGMIACMPFVFPIMVNAKFQSGYSLVPILLLASLFNVVVGLVSVIYIANKNTKAIASTSIFSAICNIVTHLCLIKFVGLYAAAISTLVSFVIMSIYRYFDVKKRYFKIKLDVQLIIRTLIVLPIVLVIYYIDNLWLNIISLVIAVLFAWILNKNSIGAILGLLKKKVKKI